MTSSLPTQLTNLSDSLRSTDSLITRLSTLTFSPGSESLSDSNSVRLELAQDIHDSLKQLEEELERVTQEAEDLAPGASHSGTGGVAVAGLRGRRESHYTSANDSQRGVQTQIARLGEDLKSSRAHFRRAQLNAKRASELAKQREREAIFASLHSPPSASPSPTSPTEQKGAQSKPTDLFAGRRPKQAAPKSAQQQEVDASTSITTSLRRTHALLTTELSRSRFAQETFDASTAALADLGEKYSSLDSVLRSSRELLGTLVRSQKSDTWYLETAFWILVGTLVWLILRRVLLGPFIWAPLWFLRWTWWILTRVGLGLGYLTGVVTTEPAASRGSLAATGAGGRTRTPLIVQPSAAGSGAIPQFDEEMAEQMRQRGGVPVGAGGASAKAQPQKHGVRENKVLEGEVSEGVGKMAQQGTEGKRETRRADGAVLKERGQDEPKNPKKKMFEADVEDERYEAQRQREQRQEDEGGGERRRRKRDEL